MSTRRASSDETLSVQSEKSQPSPEEPTVVAPETTAPLDRTPSQAARMGKKKIIAVMTALCVSDRIVDLRP